MIAAGHLGRRKKSETVGRFVVVSPGRLGRPLCCGCPWSFGEGLGTGRRARL